MTFRESIYQRILQVQLAANPADSSFTDCVERTLAGTEIAVLAYCKGFGHDISTKRDLENVVRSQRCLRCGCAVIAVLWRQPDTLTLWGIPYKMRTDVGQQPYDLWKANPTGRIPRDWTVVPEGRYNREVVPGNPCEWSEVTDADLAKP